MKKTISDKRNRTLEDLRGLRDEIRLNAHLGEMQARDAWGKLEQTLAETERQLTAAGKDKSRELLESARKLQSSIKAFRDRVVQVARGSAHPLD
jgi:hypothetical protein